MDKIKIINEQLFIKDFFQFLFGSFDRALRTFPLMVVIHFVWVANNGVFGPLAGQDLGNVVMLWLASDYFFTVLIMAIAWSSISLVVGKVITTTVAAVGEEKSVVYESKTKEK